jgi:hypothetical protein
LNELLSAKMHKVDEHQKKAKAEEEIGYNAKG